MTNSTTWTQEEDATLRQACAAGMTYKAIASEILLARSAHAVKNRVRLLGCSARRSPDWQPKRMRRRLRKGDIPTVRAAPADPLLPVLLRFGLRHRVDLCMGREAFLSAAAEHGLLKEAA